jgi:hypothetical protein
MCGLILIILSEYVSILFTRILFSVSGNDTQLAITLMTVT